MRACLALSPCGQEDLGAEAFGNQTQNWWIKPAKTKRRDSQNYCGPSSSFSIFIFDSNNVIVQLLAEKSFPGLLVTAAITQYINPPGI